MYDLVICISDMHQPYAHPDTYQFLKAVKAKYWPEAKKPIVVCGGDEIDHHSISFHDKNPKLPNASKELELACNKLKYIYDLFPKAYVLDSNHGSLVMRKALAHGLPSEVFKSNAEILGAPKEWRWVTDLTLTLSNGSKCYFHHGKSSDVLKLSQAMSMSAVQFHYHEKYKIEYWANPLGLYFAMQAACLVDDKSLAMAYNKLNLKRPIIGIGIIVNGLPRLIPMVLNKKGRWNREVE